MRSNTITHVVILGVLAIIGILGLQGYWIYQSWNQESKEFHERATIALIDVAEKIAKYNDGNLPSTDLIVRESPNYYIVNIDDVIDAGVLEHYLQSTLTQHALTLDFEYAVFDCHTRQMVYGNYCSINASEGFEAGERPMPKYEEFTYYFGIRFPSKRNYIFEEMGRIWTVTGILGVTLIFFSYAIYVILGQKRYSEMQKEFINNMTHEFKTPISSIRISSDVISKSPEIQGNERLSKYVDIIKDQNFRLNEQVEQVLSLAKLEQDQFKLKKTPVDLVSVIHEVRDAHLMRMESRSGSIELDLEENIPEILADRGHMVNVLNNLVDNAIKYSEEKPEVRIRLQKEDKGLRVEVEDKGRGIAEDQINKITDKFYRVPSGNVHDVKGFGLGLYYVKNICKAHGWNFHLESEPGLGTKCIIFMPLAK